MNEAQMLLTLGFKPSPPATGLAAPAIVGRRLMNRERHWREASATGQLETPAEIEANTVGLRTPAEQAFPSRNAPGKKEV